MAGGHEQGRRWTPARIGLVVAALIVAGGLAIQSIRINLAQAFFQSADFPTAAVVNPRDGMATGYLASVLHAGGHGQVANALALQALKQTPLSSPALGVVALDRGSTNLLSLAGLAGWRDPQVQSHLAALALEQGDATAAATHADAAARIGGPRGHVRELVDTLAARPETRLAMARRLALSPGWRAEYFIDSRAPLGDLAARAALLGALVRSASPPTSLETGQVVLIAADHMGLPRAYDLWAADLHPDISRQVADADFAGLDLSGDAILPFGWIVHPLAGIDAQPETDDHGAALHLTSDGTATGLIATQTVRLAPGRHHLQVDARYDTPAAGSAFRWVVACRHGAKFTSILEPLSGNQTGKVGFDFAVPDSPDCDMQVILLQAQQADTPGTGNAWFNHVAIL